MQRRPQVAPHTQLAPKSHSPKPTPAPAPSGLVSELIKVGHPKVSLPIPVTLLPLDLFIPEPAPQPEITLRLVSASGVELSARIAGKTFRRCIKAIVADGPMRADAFAIVQGRLGPGGAIEEAGLAYMPKPPSVE